MAAAVIRQVVMAELAELEGAWHRSQKFCGPEWCEDLPTIAGTDLQYDDGTASKIETAIVPIVERMLQVSLVKGWQTVADQ